MRLTTHDVAAAVGGTRSGPDVTVDGASIDTRTLVAGQLFVPVVAERDGHDFMPAALAAGAAAYLTARQPAGGTAVVVGDTVREPSGRWVPSPGADWATGWWGSPARWARPR